MLTPKISRFFRGSLFTLLIFALATAYRLRYEGLERGTESVGWQRWRRQLLLQNREKLIVFAQGCYGTFHVAEYSILLGGKPSSTLLVFDEPWSPLWGTAETDGWAGPSGGAAGVARGCGGLPGPRSATGGAQCA